MAQPPLTFRFKGVLFQQEGQWVAQCLDHDVASHGDSIHAATEALAKMLAEHITLALHHNQAPFWGIPTAPAKYWGMFKTGEPLRDVAPVFVPASFHTNAMVEDLRVAA